MSRPRTASRAGLTLIEVLLAVALLSAGLVVLLLSTGRCLSVARRAQQYERARHLLDLVDVVAPLDLTNEAGTVREGGFEPPFADCRWQREISEQEVEDDRAEGLFEIRTRVSWSDGGTESFEETVRLVYAPGERTAVAPAAESGP